MGRGIPDEPEQPDLTGGPEADPIPIDPDAWETKNFMVGDPRAQPPLAATLSNGAITDQYAPADILFRAGQAIAGLLKEIGGGTSPMVLKVTPTNSMTLVFGDAVSDHPQRALDMSATQAHAERVGAMLEEDGDAFFDQAAHIGRPMRHYIDLAQLLVNDDIRLTWHVRGHAPRVLTPERAQAHHHRLIRPGPLTEQSMPISGVLYRVQTEVDDEDGVVGHVGIHVARGSARPERYGPKVYPILYRDHKLEETIAEGLVGGPVDARVTIQRPRIGTYVVPERPTLLLEEIRQGAPDLQTRLVEDDEP